MDGRTGGVRTDLNYSKASLLKTRMEIAIQVELKKQTDIDKQSYCTLHIKDTECYFKIFSWLFLFYYILQFLLPRDKITRIKTSRKTKL